MSIIRFIASILVAGGSTTESVVAEGSHLLMESGDSLLLESGDNLLLE